MFRARKVTPPYMEFINNRVRKSKKRPKQPAQKSILAISLRHSPSVSYYPIVATNWGLNIGIFNPINE
jgi:hypothetical protein